MEKDVEVVAMVDSNRVKVGGSKNYASSPQQWSFRMCACCNGLQSCLIGGFCSYFLFGRNMFCGMLCLQLPKDIKDKAQSKVEIGIK